MPANVPSTRDRVLARLAREFDSSTEAIGALLEQTSAGSKIPFLSTFASHRFGGMDARRMYELRDRVQDLELLEEHRSVVLETAEREGWLDAELLQRVLAHDELDDLEDEWQAIRRRHTGAAQEARAKGLGALATALRDRTTALGQDALSAAEAYVDPSKGVPDARAALEGARAILVEEIDAPASLVDALLDQKVHVEVQGQLPKSHPFDPVLKLDKSVRRLTWYEVLLLKKAQREGMLRYEISLSEERAHQVLSEAYAKDLDAAHPLRAFWDTTLRAAWLDRLKARVETQVQRSLKLNADRTAIRCFGEDYEGLLCTAPFRDRKVLGVLPAIKRSARVAVVDASGNTVVSHKLAPVTDENRATEVAKFRSLVEENGVEVIAIGAGAGCREFEHFVLEALTGLASRPQVLIVSEENALGPQRRAKGDVGSKKAAAIARRVQDPLLEWGRLEPTQVPLGPLVDEVYQRPLQRHLESVRERVFHEVGVDLARATTDALAIIGDMGRETALKLILERDSEGGLPTLQTLVEKGHMDAAQLDASAPFIRHHSTEPLDALRLPPSRYGLVEEMAASLSLTKAQLLEQPSQLDRLQVAAFDREGLDRETLQRIVRELRSATRDPRPSAELARYGRFASVDELTMGTEVEGRVTRITSFGAFVDVGVAPAGLLHASQIAEHYVRDPGSMLSSGQILRLRVLENDKAAGRLALTLRHGDIQKIPRTLGDAAAGKRRPTAVVVRPGSRDEAPVQRARFEQQRGRGGRPGGGGGRDGGGRDGGGRDGGRPGGDRGGRVGAGKGGGDNRGRGGPRRDGGDRDGRGFGREDRGSIRGSFVVESAEIKETLESERGYGGELKSFAALAGLVRDKTGGGSGSGPKSGNDGKARKDRDASRPADRSQGEAQAARPTASEAPESTVNEINDGPAHGGPTPEAPTQDAGGEGQAETKPEDFGKDFV